MHNIGDERHERPKGNSLCRASAPGIYTHICALCGVRVCRTHTRVSMSVSKRVTRRPVTAQMEALAARLVVCAVCALNPSSFCASLTFQWRV